jgi:DNA-binding NtrC family response regulator/predicted hydrocarbon binding protein
MKLLTGWGGDMKKEDLNLFGFVEFRPNEGAMYFKDRRMLMTSATAFYSWRAHLVKTLGEKEARQIVIRAGYMEGYLSYVAVKKLYGQHEGYVIAPRLEELMGLQKTEVVSVCENPSAFHVEVHHYNSIEVEQHLLFNGISENPVCWWAIGFASGYCSAEREIEIYYKEVECAGCGHSRCTLVGRDAASWGDDLAALRSENGIRGFDDLEKLWAEQRWKSSLLAEQQKKYASSHQVPGCVEENASIRNRTLKAIEAGHYIVREQSMLEILDQAVCVARLNTPVLIQGETGTGKEYMINLIHQQSARREHELVSVNCAALTESLLESELFGHIRGAFTGAVTDKAGLFELAADGTLFLDELGEMPLALQAKLLRAIENGEIRRVGSNKTIRVNPRILAATNRDLQSFVTAGKFRQDLYFRLNSFVLQLPPLRERRESIPPLVQYFLRKVCSDFGKNVVGVSPEAMSRLMAYPWPGNIRELKHAIERAVVVTHGEIIQLSDLSFELRSSPLTPVDKRIDLKHGERQMIAAVLATNQGNRTATAHDLNISISTLWRKMKRYGLS